MADADAPAACPPPGPHLPPALAARLAARDADRRERAQAARPSPTAASALADDLVAWRRDADAASVALDAAAADDAGASEAAAAAAAAVDAALSRLAPRLPPHDAARALETAAGLRARADASRAAAARAGFRLPADRAPAPVPPPPAPSAPPAAATAAAAAAVRVSGRTGEAIVVGPAAVADGGALELASLARCTVRVTARLGALRLEGLTDTTVAVAAPVAGAAVVDGMEGGALAVAAHQARVHRAVGADLYLAVDVAPIMEECDRVRVAPLAPGPAGAAAGGGAWAAVKDFGWPRAGPSPHWSVLPEGERRPPQA